MTSLRVRVPQLGVDLTVRSDDPPMTIGRKSTSEIALSSRLVSSRHGRVHHDGDHWVFEDIGSTNGSFIGGQRCERMVLAGPVSIALGDPDVGELLELEPVVEAPSAMPTSPGAVLAATTGPRSDLVPVFAVDDLTCDTRGVRRLDRVSFALPTGAMLGVLGGSGAGKSTLVKAITGSDPATSGLVHFEGVDLYQQYEQVRRRIGYVPQDDILHSNLTVRDTLAFATQLRLPDERPSERAERADEVLAELGLSHRVDALVSELSGGQRKRLNVALELLSRPPLLILDEPTSGLDPANERSLMQLLRQLADGGRTVIVVTHSTESLYLCDDVLVLARGGVPAYLGPSAEFAQAVGQTNLIDAFAYVDNHPDPSQLRVDIDRFSVPASSGPVSGSSTPATTGWQERFATESTAIGRDAWILIQRSINILRNDRRNLLIIAAQAPVIGVLLVLLFNGGLLDVDNVPHDGSGASLLLAMVLAVIFVGAAGTVREIVKERPVMLREQSFGVSAASYLTAKFAVWGAIVTAQAILIVVVTTLINSGPTNSLFNLGAVNELTVVVALSGLVAVSSGLLISASVTTNDKAMTLLPVYLFAQLLFAGMIVPVHQMPMRLVSWFISSKWGLDGAAAVGDMWTLRPECFQQPDECSDNWQAEPQNLLLAVVMLIVMLAAALALTYRSLQRSDPARVLADRRANQ